jgi:hypothetical protein
VGVAATAEELATEEPLVAFSSALSLLLTCFLRGFGAVHNTFMFPIYRGTALNTTPMSGGEGKEKHPVEVRAKPPSVSTAFYELDQAEFL